MSISRLRLPLFGAALLVAAAIAPASAIPTPQMNKIQLPISTSMKCNDLSSVYQCCTDSGFCCYWYGPGEPICH